MFNFDLYITLIIEKKMQVIQSLFYIKPISKLSFVKSHMEETLNISPPYSELVITLFKVNVLLLLIILLDRKKKTF